MDEITHKTIEDKFFVDSLGFIDHSKFGRRYFVALTKLPADKANIKRDLLLKIKSEEERLKLEFPEENGAKHILCSDGILRFADYYQALGLIISPLKKEYEDIKGESNMYLVKDLIGSEKDLKNYSRGQIFDQNPFKTKLNRWGETEEENNYW